MENPEKAIKIYDKNMNSSRWEILVSISDGEFSQVPLAFNPKGLLREFNLHLAWGDPR